jgi:hypothetical protein
MKVLIKKLLRESLLNENDVTYELRNKGEGIVVLARIDGKVVGNITVEDPMSFYDLGDDECEDGVSAKIHSSEVNSNYRKRGIYIGMIKYLLQNNATCIDTLESNIYTDIENPDPHTKRSEDANNFWLHIYKNQSKYGVRVINYDGNYEISLR